MPLTSVVKTHGSGPVVIKAQSHGARRQLNVLRRLREGLLKATRAARTIGTKVGVHTPCRVGATRVNTLKEDPPGSADAAAVEQSLSLPGLKAGAVLRKDVGRTDPSVKTLIGNM